MPKRKASNSSSTKATEPDVIKPKRAKITRAEKAEVAPAKKARVTSTKKSEVTKTKKAKVTPNEKAKATPAEKANVTPDKQTEEAKGKSSDLNLFEYLHDINWISALESEFKKDYFIQLQNLLQKDYKAGVQVFPPKDLIFNAFNLTPISKVKVVILGQDPYHDDGQAMGLSFSVPDGIAKPPSLVNIYKELVNDKDIKNFTEVPKTGCIEKWAKQGVLLINATLTVEAHKANSHSKYGWQTFTDNVIKTISTECDGVVFVLWGNFAHKKEKLVDLSKHAVIKTAHPSPLSFNKWLGCKCFSNVNAQLKKFNKTEIDWTV